MDVDKGLFAAWAKGLESPNLDLKRRACQQLARILKRRVDSGEDASALLEFLPNAARLERLLERRLDREREDLPEASGYLKALVDLCALVRVARPASCEAGAPPLTALRFAGGASHVGTRHPEVSDGPWTAEFWVRRDGPSGGSCLSSSRGCSILLRCGPESGMPGCVGLSLGGGTVHAFSFEAPTGRTVHLTFVCASKPSRELRLYADGDLVGRLPGVSAPLPMTSLGDPKTSFRGLLFGARFWIAALPADDIRAAAANGPLAKVVQSGDDCVADWDLQGGVGYSVDDRSGDSPATLAAGCSWEELGAWPFPDVTDAEPVDVEKVTVAGEWARLGSGGSGRYGKDEKEPVELTYWRDGSGDGVGGGGGDGDDGGNGDDGAEDVRIRGTIRWFDLALAATVRGRLEPDSGAISFAVERFSERGRKCEVDAGGAPTHQWLLTASFKGTIKGRGLAGTWEATRTHRPEPPLPTGHVGFSHRRSATLEVARRTLKLGSRDGWATALVHHAGRAEDCSPVAPAAAAAGGGPPPPDLRPDPAFTSGAVLNRSSGLAVVRAGQGLPATAPHVYFECTVKTSKPCRIGWMAVGAAEAAAVDGPCSGLGELPASIGLDASASTPQLWRRGAGAAFEPIPCAGQSPQAQDLSGLQWQAGSVVGCLLAPGSGEVRFSLDGHNLGVADLGDWLEGKASEAEASGTPVLIAPAASLPPSQGASFNFGEKPFAFAPPQGFESVLAASAVARPGLVAAGQTAVKGTWTQIAECPSLSAEPDLQPGASPARCVMSGRYLWEFRVDSLGSSGIFGSSAVACVGVCRPESALGTGSDHGGGSGPPGHDALSWGWLSSGEKYHKERASSYGQAWRAGDVVGMELDMARGSLAFYRNSKHQGDAFLDLAKFGGGDGGGLVPCVALASKAARVSLLGLKRGSGAIEFKSGDELGRLRWEGGWSRGRRHGEGVLAFAGSEAKELRGTWVNGLLHGVAEASRLDDVPLEEQLGKSALAPAVFTALGFKRTRRRIVSHEVTVQGPHGDRLSSSSNCFLLPARIRGLERVSLLSI